MRSIFTRVVKWGWGTRVLDWRPILGVALLACGSVQSPDANENSVAIAAERRYHVNNPDFEYAGFLIKKADGTIVSTPGKLIQLKNQRAQVGQPPTEKLEGLSHIIGFYHTHPRAIADIDLSTGGHFSTEDEDYAEYYNIHAFVAIFADTSRGERAGFYRWDPGCPPSAEQDITPASAVMLDI